MITVAVYINNLPIILKSARNTGKLDYDSGATEYMLDCGKIVLHHPEDGAAKLSQLILKHYEKPKHG